MIVVPSLWVANPGMPWVKAGAAQICILTSLEVLLRQLALSSVIFMMNGMRIQLERLLTF